MYTNNFHLLSKRSMDINISINTTPLPLTNQFIRSLTGVSSKGGEGEWGSTLPDCYFFLQMFIIYYSRIHPLGKYINMNTRKKFAPLNSKRTWYATVPLNNVYEGIPNTRIAADALTILYTFRRRQTAVSYCQKFFFFASTGHRSIRQMTT